MLSLCASVKYYMRKRKQGYYYVILRMHNMCLLISHKTIEWHELAYNFRILR